ncbi:unnamed protein product [Amaranthus hypochondriacus]
MASIETISMNRCSHLGRKLNTVRGVCGVNNQCEPSIDDAREMYYSCPAVSLECDGFDPRSSIECFLPTQRVGNSDAIGATNHGSGGTYSVDVVRSTKKTKG